MFFFFENRSHAIKILRIITTGQSITVEANTTVKVLSMDCGESNTIGANMANMMAGKHRMPRTQEDIIK